LHRPSREPASTPVKRRVLDQAALDAWTAMLGKLSEKKAAVASLYDHASPLRVEPGTVVVAFAPGGFAAEHASSDKARALLVQVASEHFARPTTLEIELGAQHAEVETVAEQRAAKKAASLAAARKRVEEHPVVKAAIEAFDAEIRDVRLD
jgi:hypothetical protein